MAVKVYLCGGDQGGWALDDDVSQVRRALQCLGDRILFSDLEGADVVHSVWPLALRALPSEHLRGKRVITHIPGGVAASLQDPWWPWYRRHTSVWIAQSQRATLELGAAGVAPVHYVPYAVDTSLFHPKVAIPPSLASTIAAIRAEAPHTVIIGSFQRDSEGSDLSRPKLLKGPDILIEVLLRLRGEGVPLHLLLAGPRRHWMRSQLRRHGVPFTFFGTEVAGDDIGENVLPRVTLAALYRAVDLYLMTSRSEGGPRSVLEAAATETPLIATDVGITSDLVHPLWRGRSLPEMVALARRFLENRESLSSATAAAAACIEKNHTPQATAPRWEKIYESILMTPAVEEVHVATPRRSVIVPAVNPAWREVAKRVGARLGVLPWLRRQLQRTARFHVSMVYEFKRPPYGGGNQFFLALRDALRARGLRVSENRFANDVDVFLLNSHWFPVERFTQRAEKITAPIVHRIDGPTLLVRGNGDRAPDDECFSLNRRFASRTIFQSLWSLERTLELGYQPVAPVVIPNAVDPRYFFQRRHDRPVADRTLSIVASSWSDNPRKGGPDLAWLDQHLDWEQFEMTFVGRVKEEFRHIRKLPAVGSQRLGEILRTHDVYFTASRSDPCSNALIEGQACGLPAIVRSDGGHPELVSWGGLRFSEVSEVPALLQEMKENYDHYRRLVTPPLLHEVAELYAGVLERAIEERSVSATRDSHVSAIACG